MQLTRDPPCFYTEDGLGVWSVEHSYAASCVWIQAMAHGELCMQDGVSHGAIVRLLEYEGIDTPGNLVTAVRDAATVAAPRLSLLGGRLVGMSEKLRATSEAAADGILAWPRLATELWNQLSGGELRTGHKRAATGQARCSGSRAWIGFPPRPNVAVGVDGQRDVLYDLAQQRAPWLMHVLRVLGAMRLEYGQATESGESDQCDAAAFRELDKISQIAFRTRFVEYDGCKHYNSMAATAFVYRTAGVVTSGGPVLRDSTRQLAGELQFARAVVSLAETLMHQRWPSLHAFFDGSCADDQQQTPERAAFARALKARRVRVVRWAQDDEWSTGQTPLCFPPVYDSGTQQAPAMPKVLLSFEAYA